jgi:hypothetical protein
MRLLEQCCVSGLVAGCPSGLGLTSNPVPDVRTPTGIRAIKSDQTVSLPGWASDVILRLVVYQLTDGKIIRVLTSRHDLSALSIAMLYKERWSIEKWWRWLKRIYKVKEPLGESENALFLPEMSFPSGFLLRAWAVFESLTIIAKVSQDSVVDNIDNNQSASAATWGLRNIVAWEPGLRQTFKLGAQLLHPAALLSKLSSLAC